MLEDMYPLAVENGIKADEYWSLTFDEILVQTFANQKIKENDIKQQATLDYRMTQLMTFALNDPKKMPKFEEAYPFADEENGMTDEEKAQLELERQQAMMIEMASSIKATRARKENKS